MSTPQQPGRAVEAPVAAPRHSLKPVPAPRRILGPMLQKPVPCSAPCCVQARGTELPLGPEVLQPVPVPAVQAGEEQGGGQPNPAQANLGRKRRQERRRKRKIEERRIKERLLLADSSSSSCEDDTAPSDCLGAVYNNNNSDYYNTTEVANSVCEIIQISGHLHIEHIPCHDHRDKENEGGNDDDDDFDVQDSQG